MKERSILMLNVESVENENQVRNELFSLICKALLHHLATAALPSTLQVRRVEMGRHVTDKKGPEV